MLAELRQALADTVAVGMGPLDARVLPCPPKSIDMPPSGVHAYVAPADPYLGAWRSFTTGGQADVNLEVVIHVPDTSDPAAAWDLLDSLIDPLSGATNVFSAVVANPTLGITDFQVTATPLLTDVSTADRVSYADGNVTFYRLILPVQVIVKRS